MIGVIVGMKSEAALIPSGPLLGCAAAVPARADSLARALIEQGAEALISVGIAGGLDPALSHGDVIIGTGVVVDGKTVDTDSAWAARLLAALPQARGGLVYAADRVIKGVAGKARLRQEFGAAIVDMESAAVARAAQAAGKPFAVLRTVADPACRALPRSALAPLAEDGSPRVGAVLAGLARRPWELPGLIRLGLDSQAALSALRDALQVVGPAFRF